MRFTPWSYSRRKASQKSVTPKTPVQPLSTDLRLAGSSRSALIPLRVKPGPWACLRAVPPLLGFSRRPPFRGSSRDRSLFSRRADDASNSGSGKKSRAQRLLPSGTIRNLEDAHVLALPTSLTPLVL